MLSNASFIAQIVDQNIDGTVLTSTEYQIMSKYEAPLRTLSVMNNLSSSVTGDPLLSVASLIHSEKFYN
jgi:hypothetical protein